MLFTASRHNLASALNFKAHQAELGIIGRLDKIMKKSWSLYLQCLGAIVFVVGAPLAYYRSSYSQAKRVRIVTPGRFYRSGQMQADALRQFIHDHGIRTVINLQNETPDPNVGNGQMESQVCAEMGARYVFLPPDLIDRYRIPKERPATIDQYLQILDDPNAYPVLLHCKAGLHRTGVLTALYRMEYEGWTLQEAHDELLRNGFGRTQATVRNDYIQQYLVTYKPRGGPKPPPITAKD